jgi:uncharacterized metal-binding protein
MNGKAHATATVALAACCLPFALVDARALSIGAGALSNLLVGPDLDVLAGGVVRLKRAWEPAGELWEILWLPYAVIHEHRGTSHWPIYGTLVRALYLSPLWALWAKFGTVPWAGVALWAVGLALADLLHIIMDR